MMEKYNYRKDPHQDIDHVFRDLLPAHGMVERPAQVELSHQMLDAMLNGSIALCDAGTGIGKTYAYLVAGVVFRRYRSRAGLPNQPLLISTSSIALQGAIIHDYLPFLSKVMMADGMLDSPLRAVLRKGKSHYVCDARLMKRLQTANLDRKNPLAKAALLSMRDHLDLDMAPHLSGYDRERICVPPTCDCGKTECRYLCYLDVCASERYAIQVCNHNLLLADAIHRGSGKRSILPDSCAIVMDEAHKLTEIARQMFGITLEAGELHSWLQHTCRSRSGQRTGTRPHGSVQPENRPPRQTYQNNGSGHIISLLKRTQKTEDAVIHVPGLLRLFAFTLDIPQFLPDQAPHGREKGVLLLCFANHPAYRVSALSRRDGPQDTPRLPLVRGGQREGEVQPPFLSHPVLSVLPATSGPQGVHIPWRSDIHHPG